MTDLILNGMILLMIGANFVCLRIVVGTWLLSLLPDSRNAQQSVNIGVFTVAILLTLWGLTNYFTHAAQGPLQG